MCHREVLIRLTLRLTGASLGLPPEKLAAIEIEIRTLDPRKIYSSA